MNEHSPIISRAKAIRQAERRAFLKLTLTQRRLAWQYRRWAQEDEQAGNLDGYRRHIAEAERLRRDAHWHLDRAKETPDA